VSAVRRTILRLGLKAAIATMEGRKMFVRSVAVFLAIIAAIAIPKWRE
jgi:hypothetical protein